MNPSTRVHRPHTRHPRPTHCAVTHRHGRHASDATPREYTPADPRARRPHRPALSRSHTSPTRQVGTTCRHTAGLDDVWSARHAGTVTADREVQNMNNDKKIEAATAAKAQSAPAPDAPGKVDSPQMLTKPSWVFAWKKAVQEFSRDECTDQAAALTYYSVLALFPGLLTLVALVGVLGDGQRTVNSALETASQFAPKEALDLIRPVIEQMVTAQAAGFALVIGMLGALWSASGYVGAFSRAMNRVYGVTEGRPLWKLIPTQLVLTFVMLLLVSLVMVAMVVSGPVARTLGDLIDVGDTVVTVWELAKLPVILLIVMVLVAMLYYFTPNVQQPRFRWISVGAAVALASWVVVSSGFGFYVANFGSYNKTYGALAGVIVFLMWLWLTNVSLLFGAELDSELERARQLQSGIVAEECLQLPPRDAAGAEKRGEKLEGSIEEGRQLRLKSEEAHAEGTGRSKDSRRAEAN
ncbi:YihY/virulence factor BrkB family protein [Austwickia chelonae]|uniref:YihY/virulence factor BrkB family protein n=1 Tax=Austwickia chelonae TaxID=100225 RepID=UPI0031FDC7E5